MKRREFLAGVAAGTLIVVSGGAALAQWVPDKPVNVILPYAAGGGTDAFARAVSAAADGILPVPMVVVNKEGAGGITGAVEAAGARPDGSTIMITSAGSFLLTSMLKDTPVNPLDNFKIVAQVGDLDPAVLVPANSPYNTLPELVEAMKAEPGKLRWAHNGKGGAHHVAGQSFLDANAITATDVPFKGGGPTRAAVIGGQVDFAFVGIQQAAGYENELRVLGIAAPVRDGIATDVPTIAEQGLKYVEVSSPIVAFAPKDTPDEIVGAMQEAFKKIAATDKFAELMKAQGNVPEFLSGADAETRLRKMMAETQTVIDKLK